MPETVLTGGCQCGAVRYALHEWPQHAHICHCRMCQKAFGSFFGPLVTSHGVVWTRGAPKHFRSSDKVRRGFCGECGTPLTYEVDGEDSIEVAIGAFDEPTVAAPVLQVNMKDKQPFFDGLTALPVRTEYSERWMAFMQDLVSYQHPDHETEKWAGGERA
jgi:hypothetical protein